MVLVERVVGKSHGDAPFCELTDLQMRSTPMTSVDFITELFCKVDDV